MMRPRFEGAEPAVLIDRLGVEFHLNREGGRGGIRLRHDGIRAFQDLIRRKRKRDFWALRDVSLEIAKGEIFGILGGNGAGKSTLLKAAAGIIPPTEGSIRSRGTIAPLIELGAAINPDLTGVENIYLAGSLYRVPRKDVRDSLEQIVEFAGLRKFIDSPVRNYSSGMFVRLAFSMIIFFKPEIVLIDEVFSVGDQVFQQKSFEKILGFKEQGATIVIVSHDLSLLGRICDRALVLSRGRAAFIGPVEEAIGKYDELVRRGEGLDAENGRGDLSEGTAREAVTVDEAVRLRSAGVDLRRWGNRRVEITGVTFVDSEGRKIDTFTRGGYFEARLEYRSHLEKEEGRPVFGAAISTPYKMLISGPNTLEADWASSSEFPREGVVRFIIPELPLFGGEYLFSASAYNENLSEAYDHRDLQYSFRVRSGPEREFGLVKMNSNWIIERRNSIF
jgi:ABC-type polysaccharide/polyol phosphate transport system ATPase subunit